MSDEQCVGGGAVPGLHSLRRSRQEQDDCKDFMAKYVAAKATAAETKQYTACIKILHLDDPNYAARSGGIVIIGLVVFLFVFWYFLPRK